MPSQDYYADAAPAEGAENQKPSESDSNVATLPKQVLGGKEWKPGEEIVLKIVQVTDDGVVVEYAPEKGEEEEPPHDEAAEQAPPEPANPGGGGGMASMYS